MSKVVELVDVITVRVENYMTLKPEIGKINTLGMSRFNAPKVF